MIFIENLSYDHNNKSKSICGVPFPPPEKINVVLLCHSLLKIQSINILTFFFIFYFENVSLTGSVIL